MKAVEFVNEVTDPRNPPKYNSPEFEKSKQSFIKFINAAVADYNKDLSNLKSFNIKDYNDKIKDTNVISNELQKKITDALVSNSNGFIVDRDVERFKQVWPMKFPSGKTTDFSPTTVNVPMQKPAPAQKPVPMTRQGVPLQDLSDKPRVKVKAQGVPVQQKADTAKKEPIELGGHKINPDNPLYDKIMKGRTPESINEALLQFDQKTGQVKVNPRDVERLANIATQRWYANRQLKTQNPKLWAQIGNNDKVGSTQSTGISRVNNQILSKAFDANPQNPEFLQSLVNILYQPAEIEKLKEKLKLAGAPKPKQNKV